MYLTEVSLSNVVKKQVSFKLKAYLSVFTTLVVIQILSLVFSVGGTSMMGSSSGDISITVHYYSSSLNIVFTMIWAFIISILITTRAYRYDDFTFITNRLSSNISNIIFLLLASIIGGVIAFFSGSLLKAILYLVGNSENLLYISYTIDELFIGVFAAILYILLFASLGYMVGTLVQSSKVFMYLVPMFFFGLWFIPLADGQTSAVAKVVEFFGEEYSFGLFVVKVVVIVGLLFAAATFLTNRMEVKS